MGQYHNYRRDINVRPLYANYIGADIMVSIHNNGGGGDECNAHGTETWYDALNGYQVQSEELANLIHNRLVEQIQAEWDGDWCDRGVKLSDGTDGRIRYAENRLFNGPAIIIELAFMDVQSDNDSLKDATFRSIVTTAIHDAIVDYLGDSGEQVL